jgi:hypothetical protein
MHSKAKWLPHKGRFWGTLLNVLRPGAGQELGRESGADWS